ncbi:MAG: tetratricopeptide repeat protein [Endomicrobium sp.]|jgi:tetratricopeptide (TPR) repeat protein|nr:tetratricopeptide repeat protein [Endomicrobium sp.]
MLKKIPALKILDKNLKHSLIATLCFIVVTTCVYFIRDLTYSRDYILQKANEYYSKEKHFRAARYFSKAIKLNVSDAEVYKKYGTSLLKLGNYSLAAKYFGLASSIDSYDEDAYYFLGNALYRKAYETGDKEAFLQAVEYIERAIELNPDSEKLYLLAGLCCRGGEFYEKARTFYNKALASNKFNKAGFYNLIGNIFDEEGNYKEAAFYYGKAISHDNSFAVAFCNRGDMFLKTDDYESALQNYQKAVEIDETFIIAHIKIANFYYDKNNFSDSIIAALKALKINSEDNNANYILGMSYKQLGRYKESLDYLKKAAFYGNDNALKEIKRQNVL